MRHPGDSVQSQYAASPVIRALVEGINLRIDPGADIDLFYEKIFNIHTAEGVGLDIWGVILGVGRFLEVVSDDFLGYEGSNLHPFDQAPFYRRGVTNTHRLEDVAYRRLLLFKAFANISSSDLATLNRIFNNFFPGRNAYIFESGPMAIRYVFEFILTPYERAMFKLPFVPPRPAGVGYEWLEAPPESTFGFNGSGLQPFEQGTFNRGPYPPF